MVLKPNLSLCGWVTCKAAWQHEACGLIFERKVYRRESWTSLMFMTQQILMSHPQIHVDLLKVYIWRIMNGSVHEKEAYSQCRGQGEENFIRDRDTFIFKQRSTNSENCWRLKENSKTTQTWQLFWSYWNSGDRKGRPTPPLSRTQRFVNKIYHTRRLSRKKIFLTFTWLSPFNG